MYEDLKKAIEELETLDLKLSNLTKILGEYEEHKKKLEDTIRELEETLNTIDSKILAKKNELNLLEKSIVGKNEASSRELEQVKQEIQSAKAEIEKAKSDVIIQLADLAEQRNELAIKLSQADKTLSEAESSRLKYVELLTSIENKQEEILAREKAVSSRELSVGSLEQERRELSDRLRVEQSKIDAQIKDLQVLHQRYKDEENLALQKIKEADTKLADAETLLKSADEKFRVSSLREEETKKKEEEVNKLLIAGNNRQKDLDAYHERIRLRELKVQKLINDNKLQGDIKRMEEGVA